MSDKTLLPLPAYQQLCDAWLVWLRDYKQTGTRFGQYIYNKYDLEKAPWPELFYEQDNTQAFVRVHNYIINRQEMPTRHPKRKILK